MTDRMSVLIKIQMVWPSGSIPRGRRNGTYILWFTLFSNNNYSWVDGDFKNIKNTPPPTYKKGGFFKNWVGVGDWFHLSQKSRIDTFLHNRPPPPIFNGGHIASLLSVGPVPYVPSCIKTFYLIQWTQVEASLCVTLTHFQCLFLLSSSKY